MFYKSRHRPQANCHGGFTLSELMVASALIGLVLVLTITLVLYAGDTRTSNTMVGQAAQVVSNAYVRFQLNHVPKATTGLWEVMPYARTIQGPQAMVGVKLNPPHGQAERGAVVCGQVIQCYELQGGGVVWFDRTQQFDGTQANNAVAFAIDADGHYKPDPNAAQSVELLLYFDGRLFTWGDLRPETTLGGQLVSSNPDKVPPWFRW